MKVGITYDLKGDEPAPLGAPDDFFEEFDAPDTVDAIADVLQGLGHTPIRLGNGRPLLERLLADPPDFVFNFAEGRGIGRSRESRVPAVLEMLDIPYTGSDPATLGVALDKDWTKRIVHAAGVRVPRGAVVARGDDAEAHCHDLTLPLLAKPVCEGSSKGIRSKCLIEHRDDLAAVVDALARGYHQSVLVEEFIRGDELTAGVVGNDPSRVIGVMRVVPKAPTQHFVYSLEVKRDWRNCVDYEAPAKLPPGATESVIEAALKVFRAVGCRDIARLDFRLRDGVPFFIEINPLPGLNPQTGDLILLAKGHGMTYSELIGSILQSARERTGR
jgi:D-alanine-D-alanine ligase